MSKSIFSTWSRLAREVLVNRGCKLSHGQVMEVLAAGLGHNTYASFKRRDEAAAEQAQFVVLSFEAMQRRAREFSRIVEDTYCFEIVQVFNANADEKLPKRRIQRLEEETWVSGHALEMSSHALLQSLTQAEKMIFDGVATLLETPSVYSEDAPIWLWSTTGNVLAHSDGTDYEIPFSAELLFDKLGRHLMSQGSLANLEQRGKPSFVDDGYFSEGYVSESQL